jgi:signal transduction histidine kinase
VAQQILPQVGPARMARMLEMSRELNSTTNLDALLKLITSEAADLTGAQEASILLLDPQTRKLRFRSTSVEMRPEMADMPIPLENSIAGFVLQENKPLIVNDVSRDPRWNPVVSETLGFPTDSILGVPMHGDSEPVGVIEALNKLEGKFAEEDVAILTILADMAGVAVEKARLIDALQSANQQLSELDRLKSSFIAVASHELRTPLAVILGYVSHLRDAAPPEKAHQFDSVLDAAVRLRSLIQDMLNLQYVDAEETTVEQALVNLTDLIRDIVASRDEMAMAKQQRIERNLPDDPLRVLADVSMIQVVLENLIANAIKFTPERGRITVSLAQQGDEAWVTVADNGIGVREDQLDRIFNRFYQVESHLSRNYEGMGLGLAIAKDLVELNGGRIWAQSKLGEGSQFVVALPVHEIG